MDEPQSNPSCVPLWFLAKLAREHVTVVLSGEGADELFAGYDWYADTKEVRTFKKYVPACVRHALSSMVKPLPKFKGRSFLLRASGRPEDYFIGNKRGEMFLMKLVCNGSNHIPECWKVDIM